MHFNARSHTKVIIENVVILVSLWSIYFAIHSVLASLTVKRRLQRTRPSLMPYYRIGFNVLATLLLILPVGFMFARHGPVLWQWQGYAKWLADGLATTAILAFFWTLRFYDMKEFTGFKQTREKSVPVQDQETLKISPIHRYVRHPWYFLGLIIIWSRGMDTMYLTSAITVTLYLFLGSKLEEKKLMAYHGAIYRHYCEEVPGIIPRPWRYLSKAQAIQLQNNASAHKPGL
jgi:protein-S-isoprenylcysteine O-methyltransferase Ste14